MPEPGSAAFIKAVTEAVDDQVLVNADQRQGDWLSYGKNYSEDRYITLDQINRDNIDQLGLAWSLNLETRRGLETTSIVVDGIMYITGNYSLVHSILPTLSPTSS